MLARMWWIAGLLWVFYLLMAGNASWPEMVVATIATATALFASSRSSQAGVGWLQVDPLCYPGALRLPWRMVKESVHVLSWTAGQLLRGRPLVGTERWDTLGSPCGRAEPDSDRAVMVFCISAPPGSVVVDQQDDRVLINEVIPGEPASEWRKL